MSVLRPLRGGCQCGRNKYMITVPQDGLEDAQVHFNTESAHQIPLGTPLAAYIRVPLSWYHSITYSFFPDETHTMIRRVYTHPSQQHSKRHFCGFCGTPLSYWSENPHTEAEYINLTLGSLLREDIRDLEEMGIMPDQSETEEEHIAAGESKGTMTPPDRELALRQSFGVPWFDTIVEGTRLGKMRRGHGIQRSQDGRINIEWEVVDYTNDESQGLGSQQDMDTDMDIDAKTTPSKRKLTDREDSELVVKR